MFIIWNSLNSLALFEDEKYEDRFIVSCKESLNQMYRSLHIEGWLVSLSEFVEWISFLILTGCMETCFTCIHVEFHVLCV